MLTLASNIQFSKTIRMYCHVRDALDNIMNVVWGFIFIWGWDDTNIGWSSIFGMIFSLSHDNYFLELSSTAIYFVAIVYSRYTSRWGTVWISLKSRWYNVYCLKFQFGMIFSLLREIFFLICAVNSNGYSVYCLSL